MTRIVVFGATGYTGRMTAEAMVRRGLKPVLAGRSAARLDLLSSELGGLEVGLADVSRPESVRDLVGEGDVIVSAVGPFVDWGDAAADAAVTAGAHYLDCAGEPPFIRRVFDHYGPRASAAGIAMLPAFGYEGVAGNLAGALALRDAGEAVRVDTGYFLTGRPRFPAGTRASLVGAMALPSFAYRDRAIRTVRGGDRYRRLPADGRRRPGVSLGGSEHFGLPRSFPALREVNAYLGWFGPLSRPLHLLSPVGFAALELPWVRAVYQAAAARYVKAARSGPTPEERARYGSHVVGIAYDARGAPVAEAHLCGVDGWDFTAAILAWGAERAAAGAMSGAGALGPVQAFGLDRLEEGCAAAGLARVKSPSALIES